MTVAPKPAVQVKFAVRKVDKPLDAKLAAGCVAAMEKAAEAAVMGSSKLKLGKPTGKDAKGFIVDGAIDAFTMDSSGRKLNGTLSISAIGLGGAATGAKASSKGNVSVAGPDKVKPADLNDLAVALVEGAMTKVVSYMESAR